MLGTSNKTIGLRAHAMAAPSRIAANPPNRFCPQCFGMHVHVCAV